jgi:hypothetical protein
MVIDAGAAGTFSAMLESFAAFVSELPQIEVYLHFTLSDNEAASLEAKVTVSTLESKKPESIVMLETNEP